MLQVKNVKVYDLEESVIASRNAMRTELPEYTEEEFEKSLNRAIKLAATPDGSGHQTFLSGIRVSFDLIYPNYISPELQRYHWVDIVTSSSKMHKLLSMNVDETCNKYVSKEVIEVLERDIKRWQHINDSEYEDGHSYSFVLRDNSVIHCTTKADALYTAFMKCVSDCPQGIELFMRISTNYLQLKNIYHQRKNHKLKEDWGAFCKFIEELPYAKEFIL